MSIFDEIKVEADRAASLYSQADANWSLSDWSCFILTYAGEAFSVRHRDIGATRTSLIKLGGLVVNCVRQIDSGNLNTHEV